MRIGVSLIGLWVGLVAGPLSGRAQLFSPGKLSRDHAHLEGLENCTQCHQAGQRLAEQLCLKCHREIDVRVRAKTGYHGRLAPSKRACEACHREHQGRDFRVIDWVEERFRHQETGWLLRGAHQKVRCRACHQKKLVRDKSLRALLKRPKKKRTFLGLGTRCVACHFDEHRGQTSSECTKCHDDKRWKPASKFDHQKTKFALRGKHRSVECAQCHPEETDNKVAVNTLDAHNQTFLRFAPVEHGECASCHEDPHQGRFGSSCSDCHVETGWKRMKTRVKKSRLFHDRTRYPLRGEHRKVACRACHGPFLGQKAIFRGLAFSRCKDCHDDAHLGQLSSDCVQCHTVNAFMPAQYGSEEHKKTRYPLEGAHEAVACTQCHPTEQNLKAKKVSKMRRRAKRKRRRLLVSRTVFKLPEVKGACETCHQDPHEAQFRHDGAEKACVVCHKTSSFRDLSFDHNVDSRFLLEGRHQDVACRACHFNNKRGVTRFRPLDVRCGSCHSDVHGGQFERTKKGAWSKRPCGSCHSVSGFRVLKFDHQDPKQTRFILSGRHQELECGACHRLVSAGDGPKVRKYRGVPLRCEGCHADFHEGAFRGYEP